MTDRADAYFEQWKEREALAQAALPIPIARYPEARYSWVEARPLTGRYHQIRRHLARINHPVIGDAKHGDYQHNQLFRDHLELPGLMLCARSLRIEHPVSGEPLEISAAPGPGFVAAATRLGWEVG